MLLSDTVTYRVRSRPDDVALIFQDAVITYADLAERFHRLANALSDLAAPGDRVAILSENRPEYIECYYGVPRAGMGLCFINFRLAPREIVRIINDAEPVVLVTEAPYLELVNGIRPELTTVSTWWSPAVVPGPATSSTRTWWRPHRPSRRHTNPILASWRG